MRKLANAVGGGATELAEALDMTEHSLEGVLQGQLPIDEERFNHINPQLMNSGFPDGWLDEPQATVHSDWIRKLRSGPDAVEAGSPEPHREKGQQPAVPMAQTFRDPNVPVSSNATERAFAMNTTPSPDDSTSPQEPVTEASSSVSEETSPIPSGGSKREADVQRPRAKRRGARASKRARTAEAAVETAVSDAEPAPRSVAEPRAAEPKQPDTKPKPGRRKAAASTPAPTPEPAAPPPAPQEPAPDAGRSTRTPISHAESQKRAEALERLLSTARRGAKVTLWRDLLGLSLPYWGNIRRGSLLLRDELAERITAHLGLPKGWFSKPVFPPAKVADWVMDASVPLPTTSQTGSGPQDAAEAVPPAVGASHGPKPDARRKPDTRKPVVAPDPTADAGPGAAADPQPSTALMPEDEAVPEAAVESPAAQPPHAPSRAEPPVAPAAAATTSASDGSTFSWTPARQPEPRPAPGPLVEALGLVLGHLSVKGEFTDDDALRLMAMFSAKR